MDRRKIWANRRVLVTGHTGFKGAWLSLMLRGLGSDVSGFALEPVADGIYRRAGVDEEMDRSTIADVRNGPELKKALGVCRPSVVFHLAAQPLVRLSYDEPVETFAVNVMGTVNLLEAVRATPSVKAVVVVTSDKCYENQEWVWAYREHEPMGGYDPYSSSKGCSELVVSSYRRSFFSRPEAARIASARAGNVIGGGDVSADRLVPDLVRDLRIGRPPPIRNPGAIRPWQHVLDPLTGYIVLAEHLLDPAGSRYADGWNFGPDSSSERSVRDVVEGIGARWQGSNKWHRDARQHVHEAAYLKLDSSKAHHLLGWRPGWAFDAALDETVDWYRAETDGLDMRAKTMEQISRHEAAVRRS